MLKVCDIVLLVLFCIVLVTLFTPDVEVDRPKEPDTKCCYLFSLLPDTGTTK